MAVESGHVGRTRRASSDARPESVYSYSNERRGSIARNQETRSWARRKSSGSFSLEGPPGAGLDSGAFDNGKGIKFQNHDTRSWARRRSSGSCMEPQFSNSLASDMENTEELGKLDFNLGAIDEKKSYAPSTEDVYPGSESPGSNTTTTALTSMSSRRLPDFFATEVFQSALRDQATSHQLLKFSQSRLCGENLEFLEKVARYHSLLKEAATCMFEIHRDYISVTGQSQINIPESVLIKINKDMRSALTSTFPKLESVFLDAQNEIEGLVATDIYPRFVRHQMTASATRALAGDQERYAGLGDCFVLTDPAKADNPIVYASDRFVEVTGYDRNEIIPRNCRFLQTGATDTAAVRRLRGSIDGRTESVELLLNQKKNGEPFWNLLHTTPLFDAKGRLAFFLGGQINCSTTVHSASDMLKILAISEDADEHSAPSSDPQQQQKNQSLKNKFFPSFKSKPTYELRRQPGMEEAVLSKIEKMDTKNQMDEFGSAYSKFLVIDSSTFHIAFHSAGLSDLLYPPTQPVPNDEVSQDIIGKDAFRFLTKHSACKLSHSFKHRVRAALKAGQAISLDLTLRTRRSMGTEKFTLHWTPLKNEVGKVGFVILMLGGSQD